VRATHTHDGRRDTRLDSCIVAARATTSRVGSLPRTCRTLRLHLDDFTHGDCRAGARVSASRDEALALEPPDHEASEHEGSNALHGVAVWRPSTVAEHRELPAREEETANAPGRSEGRCEHLDPAVARRRDGRLDGLPRMREAHGQPRPTSRTLRCSGRRLRTEGVASTRTSRPRPHEGSHVRATHTHDGRRDTRLDSCIVAARATTSRVGSLPRTCRTLRLHLDDFTHGDCRAGARVSASRDEALALEPPDHEASEHAGSNALHGVAVWRPSTVAEHRELPAREEETANAPGRSEGRCEHLDPAVARRRDGRLDGLPRMREAHGQPRPTSRTLRCSGRRFRTEGVASTRTSRPRPYEGSHVRATHTHDGRRDTRLDSCIVAARATTYVSGLSLGPAGRFACTSTTSRTATAALGRESARLATRLSPWSRRITKRRSTKGRMHCTEWPCGARAPSPSTASCQLVRRRPRMPPAGPRGGASTSTPPSRADAMAASTVCLGCVNFTHSVCSSRTARRRGTARSRGRMHCTEWRVAPECRFPPGRDHLRAEFSARRDHPFSGSWDHPARGCSGRFPGAWDHLFSGSWDHPTS
jgi:hypothetical protein